MTFELQREDGHQQNTMISTRRQLQREDGYQQKTMILTRRTRSDTRKGKDAAIVKLSEHDDWQVVLIPMFPRLERLDYRIMNLSIYVVLHRDDDSCDQRVIEFHR